MAGKELAISGSDDADTTACDICSASNKQSSALHYCKTHDIAFCGLCISSHLTSAGGHDLVNASVMKQYRPAIDMKGVDKCKSHAKLVEYFCEDHKELCCNTCALVTGGHRDCSAFHEIEKAKSPITTEELQKRLEKSQKTSGALIKFYDDTEKNLKKQVVELQKDLEDMRAKLVKQFEDTKTKINNEATAFREEKMIKLNADKADAKNIIDETERFLKWLDNVTEKGTKAQIFIAVYRLEKKIASYQEVLRKKHDDLCTYKLGIKLNEHLIKLLESKEKLAQLKFTRTKAALPGL